MPLRAEPQIGFVDSSDSQVESILSASANQRYEIQAEARNISGFTIAYDFEREIEDNLRNEAPCWNMIKRKRPAPSITVRRIRKTNRPKPGFVNRNALEQSQTNSHADTANDLSDPGQDVKALTGIIEFDHFDRSMADQQGRIYGDEVAQETQELLTNTLRTLEMALFCGDASAGDGLEFNGLEKLMPAGSSQVLTRDISSNAAQPESIVSGINEICARMTSDRNKVYRPTIIFSTSAGLLALQNEIGQSVFNQNLEEIVPGFKVPAIFTQVGRLPIYSTPYLSDVSGNGGNDILRFWVVDWDLLEWYGVYPFGGSRTFSPQIFDITKFVAGVPLVEKRMVLIYGTTYAGLSGEAIWRLDVTANPGSVWNVGGYETLV